MLYDCLLLISTLLIATGGLMASPLPNSMVDDMLTKIAQAVPIAGKLFMPSKGSCSDGFISSLQEMGRSMPVIGVLTQKLPLFGKTIMGDGSAAGIPGANILFGIVPSAKKMIESIPLVSDFLFGTKGGCSPSNMKASLPNMQASPSKM
uniref:Uncharacterized protein n=1 Tax=Timema monikensis TaxID=170555 RepID=A0A7R9HSZ8_9NEOP|nr:unnamed protein product [Timema monikensis]